MYVTLQEASEIVQIETGIDITILQLIRAGVVQNLPLCVLLNLRCHSPTQQIRREQKEEQEDPDYRRKQPVRRGEAAETVHIRGLYRLGFDNIFDYQTKESVRVNSVVSLDGQDIYYPGVDVNRDAIQIMMPYLNAFIAHIKETQTAQQQTAPVTDTAPAQTTATPAPVAADDAPEKQVDAMKKAALIAKLEHEWSSIEADISDATRNGLKAAHTGKHGEWDADKARAWAVSKGKIKQTAPVHHLASAWPGATTRNKINR